MPDDIYIQYCFLFPEKRSVFPGSATISIINIKTCLLCILKLSFVVAFLKAKFISVLRCNWQKISAVDANLVLHKLTHTDEAIS